MKTGDNTFAKHMSIYHQKREDDINTIKFSHEEVHSSSQAVSGQDRRLQAGLGEAGGEVGESGLYTGTGVRAIYRNRDGVGPPSKNFGEIC